jgi:hypothetical protein
MNQRIQISIPTPCHENWAAMTPTEKGRFCSACQKQVFDFTKASDREIAEAVKNDSQLNRDLWLPVYKKNRTGTFLAVLLGLFTIGIQAQTQTKKKPLTYHKPTTKKHPKPTIEIRGTVTDSLNVPLQNVAVLVKGKARNTMTDSIGNFIIKAQKGDALVFNLVGYVGNEIQVTNTNPVSISLKEDEGIDVTAYRTFSRRTMIAGGLAVVTVTNITKKRSFFGPIFHKIGNIFRKDE